MSEMVERVAIAIWRSSNGGLVKDVNPYGPGPHAEIMAEFADQALAAIEAMQEPTSEMKRAGYAEHGEPIEDIWQAMIDAALVIEPAG